ncbi:MAG: hypothetical protein IJU35_07195 [Paludibacteraceae bacterium]|nr:hypothetical protein [Paludibacteraceae bacterium]
MQLPEGFEELVKRGVLGAEWDAFCASLDVPSPVSVHVNDRKSVSDMFGDAEPVGENVNGFYLSSRPKFTLDPFLHAGCYYVQEASSMALGTMLSRYVPSDALVLDLCAAPGGKSIIISQYLKEKGFLVANEPIPNRTNILAENLTKWGNDNFMVTRAYPHQFDKLGVQFDAIVVDAPCSGEGMFRKEPESVRQWSQTLVEQCAERQREILAHAWERLKEHGTLIYSTCTYNSVEDEDMAQWICDELGGTFIEQKHYYPHQHNGEGFYIAVLSKMGGKEQISNKCCDLYAAEDVVPRVYSYRTIGERVVAVQKRFAGIVDNAARCLPIVLSGTEVALAKGKKQVPCHALGLSKYRDEIISGNSDLRFEYRVLDVDLTSALKYLRGEALPDDGAKGFVLIRYRGEAIGWGNNVGNRINNLYPQQWRIKNI